MIHKQGPNLHKHKDETRKKRKLWLKCATNNFLIKTKGVLPLEESKN